MHDATDRDDDTAWLIAGIEFDDEHERTGAAHNILTTHPSPTRPVTLTAHQVQAIAKLVLRLRDAEAADDFGNDASLPDGAQHCPVCDGYGRHGPLDDTGTAQACMRCAGLGIVPIKSSNADGGAPPRDGLAERTSPVPPSAAETCRDIARRFREAGEAIGKGGHASAWCSVRRARGRDRVRVRRQGGCVMDVVLFVGAVVAVGAIGLGVLAVIAALGKGRS